MDSIHLETERLTLRKFKLEDAGFILDALNQPSFIRNIGDRKVRSDFDAEEYIKERFHKHFDRHGFSMLLCSLKSNQEKIGMCGLVKREGLKIPDLGFAMLEKYQGMGYAEEAAHAILKYAANELQLGKLAGITIPSNSASIGLLEKLGFVFQKNVDLYEGSEKLMLFEKILYLGQ